MCDSGSVEQRSVEQESTNNRGLGFTRLPFLLTLDWTTLKMTAFLHRRTSALNIVHFQLMMDQC